MGLKAMKHTLTALLLLSTLVSLPGAARAQFDSQPIAAPVLPPGVSQGWFARDVIANSAILPLTGSGAQQLQLRMTNVRAQGTGQEANLLPNPGFEVVQNTTASGWKTYVRGYQSVTTDAHSGVRSIQCMNATATDVSGAYQTLYLNQTAPVPILFSGWSRASGVSGTANPDYALYADVTFTDGTKLYGQNAVFATGTHDWQQAQALITPAKPIWYVTVFGLFRNHAGTVWFDDLSVQALPDGQLTSATVEDASGRTRAVTIYYVVRAEGASLWWNDIRNAAPITSAATSDLFNGYSVNEGATGTMSYYPFGCVTGPASGRALGMPPLLGARIARIGYNVPAALLYVAFDVGLTGQNLVNSDGQGHGRADVAAVSYDVDPAWAFRDAAARYYAFFPDAFAKRTPVEGTWLAFFDVNSIPQPADFGFAFHESPVSVANDHALGLLSFRYSIPMNYEMSMPPSTPRTYDAALAQIMAALQGADPVNRSWAEAVINSCTQDANGRYNMVLETKPWNDGADWIMNPNPFIPSSPDSCTMASLLYTPAMADQLYAPANPNAMDGEFLDAVEAWRDVVDFSATGLRYTQSPPTFRTGSNRPIIPEWFNVYDLVAFMSKDLHSRNKLLMANGTGWYVHAFLPLVDVPAAEVEWMNNGVWLPDNDQRFNYRRTLSYHKPFLLLQNTDFTLFGPTQIEKYFQRGLFYGCYPSMFHQTGYTSYYFQTPSLYNRDRPLFKKYIPLIRTLSQAGWEPVTYARASTPAIYVERYGNQYLTVYNTASYATGFTITVDLARLQPVPPGSSLRVTDASTGQVLSTQPAASQVVLSLSAGSDQVRMLRLTVVP
jgi:hypothetical protein